MTPGQVGGSGEGRVSARRGWAGVKSLWIDLA